MVQFGICTAMDNAAAVKAAGWDFVEENIQGLFKGTEPDDAYHSLAKIKACPLPVPAANCLVPGKMKITGPAVDRESLRVYLERVLKRAAEANCRMLVFGSGGARNVPDGWDKAKATDQIVEFAQMIAPMAQAHGVTIVLEHLNRKECNIVNTLEEELAIVQRVNHPSFLALLDTYHLWLEDIPTSAIVPLLPHIRHVHLADKEGRVPPGESGKNDYRPVFALLKKAGYQGGISVEAAKFANIQEIGAKVLAFVKSQWTEA